MNPALRPVSYDPDEDDRAASRDVVELVAIGINAALIRAPSDREAFRRWRQSSDHSRNERRNEAATGLRFAGINAN